MSETKFDARVTPARPDIADARLRGIVEAGRYVEGQRRGVIAASAPLRRQPAPDEPLETEALFGETVTVFEEDEGWAWAQLERDSYVGYLPAAALGAVAAPTHRVACLRTHAYPGPSIKLPPLTAISLGALIAVDRIVGDFAIGTDGAHYWSRHLAPTASVEPDFVDVARRFLGVPYLWGGRTSEGLDCSGLVQTALRACGVAAPRDSDMMEAALGERLAPGPPSRRGDLVFWRGHVGILTASDTLLHANGFHMLVIEEDFREACRRIEASGGGPMRTTRRIVP